MAYKNKADAIRYSNAYIKHAYDRINLCVPKGNKMIIQELAASEGKTVNSYLNDLLANEVGEKWKRKYNDGI